MIIIYDTLNILQLLCIRCILNIRLCFNDFKESFKPGIALLKHLCKFNEHLNRGNKDVDIQGIGRKRNWIECSVGNKISTRNQNRQVQHPLKEIISCMKQSHPVIVIRLGLQKQLIAVRKFITLNVFIGEGFDNTDTGQRILQACIDTGNLTAVIHKGCLHFLILKHTENQHDQRYCNQNQGQRYVDVQQQQKGTDNFQ